MSLAFITKTYGCQMNVHESGKMSALLQNAGYRLVNKDADADIIIFNTCCIRNTAELKILSHIGETKRLKEKNPNLIICVVGCLSQRTETAQTLKRKFPHISIVLGTHNVMGIARAIEEYLKRKNPFIEILDGRAESGAEVPLLSADDENIKYVNITYGCENFCSYCIVPFVRGALVCRTRTAIETEFAKIVESGFGGTIYLLGQNVNSYICPETGANFVELLGGLCQIDGDFKVNFMSSHPKDFSRELVDAIAANPKVERNIHLPLQCGCDRVLKLMNRRYTAGEYEEKIAYLRSRVPDVHITTDIICGFPTETEDEFRETVETMRRIKFNAAYIFPYSRRSGTVADKLDGQVDTKTKKRRATELIAVQREISNKKIVNAIPK